MFNKLQNTSAHVWRTRDSSTDGTAESTHVGSFSMRIVTISLIPALVANLIHTALHVENDAVIFYFILSSPCYWASEKNKIWLNKKSNSNMKRLEQRRRQCRVSLVYLGQPINSFCSLIDCSFTNYILSQFRIHWLFETEIVSSRFLQRQQEMRDAFEPLHWFPVLVLVSD